MISDESYRRVTSPELDSYKKCEWFKNEAFLFSAGMYFIPEHRMTKELDAIKFYEDKLQEILNGFDFDKVHEVMCTLNWCWANIGIPSKEEMIAHIHYLYNSLKERIIKHEYCYCNSGGFKLSFNPNEGGELNLVFELESYSAYDD